MAAAGPLIPLVLRGVVGRLCTGLGGEVALAAAGFEALLGDDILNGRAARVSAPLGDLDPCPIAALCWHDCAPYEETEGRKPPFLRQGYQYLARIGAPEKRLHH